MDRALLWCSARNFPAKLGTPACAFSLAAPRLVGDATLELRREREILPVGTTGEEAYDDARVDPGERELDEDEEVGLCFEEPRVAETAGLSYGLAPRRLPYALPNLVPLLRPIRDELQLDDIP